VGQESIEPAAPQDTAAKSKHTTLSRSPIWRIDVSSQRPGRATTAVSSTSPRPSPTAPPTLSAGLPLPGLARPGRLTTARYALTTTDRQGRLADRSSVRALGWAPGQPISITTADDTIVIRSATDSLETLTRQGFLCLPAAIRHRCHIHTGDRLLIAAYPDHQVLLVCTLAVLDDMLDSRVSGLL
jgi:bifunctional DNA-binding transcriptional regulator/antitoxin component of YhaV-PrlF toxin-antitoxin module